MTPPLPSQTCLIVKNDGIGDLILASGIIASLTRHFARVDLVTCAAGSDIAERIPGLGRIYYVSRDAIQCYVEPMGTGCRLVLSDPLDFRAMAELADAQYDCALVLRRFIRASTCGIMSVIRAKNKICGWQFPTNTPQELLRRVGQDWTRVPMDDAPLSEAEYYAALLSRGLGLSLDPGPHILDRDGNRAAAPATGASRVAGIAIGGAKPLVMWSVGHWVALTRRLCADGWQVRLYGEHDSDLTREFIRLAGPVDNRAGQLSLADTLEDLKDCEIFVGNDTGLSHLAALVVPKVFVIMWGGTFRRFFPWPDNGNQFVIHYATECYDCDEQCRHARPYCIDLIGVEDVHSYIRDAVSGRVGPGERNLCTQEKSYPLAWKRRIDGLMPVMWLAPGPSPARP